MCAAHGAHELRIFARRNTVCGGSDVFRWGLPVKCLQLPHEYVAQTVQSRPRHCGSLSPQRLPLHRPT
eukprot:2750483-Prorocentrum_lima.AAC.1